MTTAAICTIDFEPLGKRLEVPAGMSLYDAARLAGLGLASVCGGEGTCGRCRVEIRSGSVSPPTHADRGFMSQLELDAGHRLACRTHVASDVKVHVPRASLVTEQRLQVQGIERRVAPDAAVRALAVDPPAPSLYDLRSDLDRLTVALEVTHGVRSATAQPSVVRQISPTARRLDWRMNLFVHGREIVGTGSVTQRPIGFACDLGTTKIAGYLVDLESGEELAAGGLMNPQIGYGEDVISRLAHATRSAEGAADLSRVVREALNGLAGHLADQAGVGRAQIADACIVGNTVMLHLLLDLPTRQLATAPFVAAAGGALDLRASELGLEFAPGAFVHIPPSIGGFVGADHVAMLLATELDQGDQVALGVDIGTNTEIALYRPGTAAMASASCASGPAFEGAHIYDGMRAAAGAIEAVQARADGSVTYRTIDGAPPVGLCGSGIVDAVAALRRIGVVDARGRMQPGRPGVRRGSKGNEFLLARSAADAPSRDVVLTQHDITEIQLAKGAVAAGIRTLLEVSGTAPEQVERVVVAGAFGSYLDLNSTLDIGLLPRLPHATYTQVGNAAGVGARLMLMSLKERRRAQRLAQRTSYTELTTARDFSRNFARSMLFPAPLDGGGEA